MANAPVLISHRLICDIIIPTCCYGGTEEWISLRKFQLTLMPYEIINPKKYKKLMLEKYIDYLPVSCQLKFKSPFEIQLLNKRWNDSEKRCMNWNDLRVSKEMTNR